MIRLRRSSTSVILPPLQIFHFGPAFRLRKRRPWSGSSPDLSPGLSRSFTVAEIQRRLSPHSVSQTHLFSLCISYHTSRKKQCYSIYLTGTSHLLSFVGSDLAKSYGIVYNKALISALAKNVENMRSSI